jgi:hypothetical protein
MAGWLSFLNQAEADSREEPFLTVLGHRPAASLFETWLLAELCAGTGRRKAVLVDRLTELWLRDELRQGAANVDAGLWGPRRIRGEVESLLRQLEGDFVQTVPAGLEPAVRASDGCR